MNLSFTSVNTNHKKISEIQLHQETGDQCAVDIPFGNPLYRSFQTCEVLLFLVDKKMFTSFALYLANMDDILSVLFT